MDWALCGKYCFPDGQKPVDVYAFVMVLGFSRMLDLDFVTSMAVPMPPASCLLPPASCPLPPAHCLLPTAHCPLPTAHCLLPTASCPLPPASCPLRTGP